MTDDKDNSIAPVDLTFDTEQGRFNMRAGAIIIKDDNLLMVKNKNLSYYYSVGGRVKLNESTKDAIIREAKEETGFDFEVERLGFVYENFHKNNEKNWQFHGVSFFYYLTPTKGWEVISELLSYRYCHNDNLGDNQLYWLPLDKLGKYNIVPKFFKYELRKTYKTVRHIIDRTSK